MSVNRMLSSWKEIAHFFGKGVRTVQRWEKTLDLPIRRPPGAPSNVVLARTSDLEAWMHRSSNAAAVAASEEPSESLTNAIADLEMEVRRLTGTANQPIDATGSKDKTNLDRIREVTDTIRSMGSDQDHGSLKRVA